MISDAGGMDRKKIFIASFPRRCVIFFHRLRPYSAHGSLINRAFTGIDSCPTWPCRWFTSSVSICAGIAENGQEIDTLSRPTSSWSIIREIYLRKPGLFPPFVGTRAKIADEFDPRKWDFARRVLSVTAPFAFATCSLNYSRDSVSFSFFFPLSSPFGSRSAAVPDSSFLRLTLPVLLNARSKTR